MSLTAEQKEMRRSGLGSSEIASVMGLSKWPAIKVWQSKMMPDLDEPETADQKRGRILEPAVAAWYAEDTGARLESPGTLRHPTRPRVLATPDRIAFFSDHRRTLELKTAIWTPRGEWGEAGTDHVPHGYLVQVQWELSVTGDEIADLAVLIGGHDFRVYNFKRDDELLGIAYEAGDKWWRDHIIGNKPPPTDGTSAYADFLARRYPRDEKPLLAATPDIEELMGRVRLLEEHADKTGDALDLAKNQLRALIADAEGIQGDGWRVTWKANRKGVRSLRTTYLEATP